MNLQQNFLSVSQPVFFACLFMLLSSPSAAADQFMQTFEMRFRPAQEVAAELTKVVGLKVKLTASGNILVVRAEPDEMQKIENLISRLDRRQQMFLVTVLQRRGATRLNQGSALNSPVPIGPQGRVVMGGGGRTYSTQGNREYQKTHSLKVVENRAAFIATGEAVPVKDKSVHVNKDGVELSSTTRYRQTQSGFYVRPRVSGEKIALDVSSFQESITQGDTISSQLIDTTIYISSGQWLLLGSQDNQVARQYNAIVYSTKDSRTSSSEVLIRVEYVE